MDLYQSLVSNSMETYEHKNSGRMVALEWLPFRSHSKDILGKWLLDMRDWSCMSSVHVSANDYSRWNTSEAVEKGPVIEEWTSLGFIKDPPALVAGGFAPLWRAVPTLPRIWQESPSKNSRNKRMFVFDIALVLVLQKQELKIHYLCWEFTIEHIPQTCKGLSISFFDFEILKGHLQRTEFDNQRQPRSEGSIFIDVYSTAFFLEKNREPQYRCE